jgi:hypothetical protein
MPILEDERDRLDRAQMEPHRKRGGRSRYELLRVGGD